MSDKPVSGDAEIFQLSEIPDAFKGSADFAGQWMTAISLSPPMQVAAAVGKFGEEYMRATMMPVIAPNQTKQAWQDALSAYVSIGQVWVTAAMGTIPSTSKGPARIIEMGAYKRGPSGEIMANRGHRRGGGASVAKM